ncbi:MAG TPA: hypothetical protein VIL85_28080 [Thermomicrobiales bacterium]|jgi:hypothetical protein
MGEEERVTARQTIDDAVDPSEEIAQLRAELVEARAALTLANLRMELARADLSIERLMTTHVMLMTVLHFYATREHYPDTIVKDAGQQAREVIDGDLAYSSPQRTRACFQTLREKQYGKRNSPTTQ